MCWHKWGRWSEPKPEIWNRQNHYLYSNVPMGEPVKYLRHYQDRVCEKCGKYKKRYINE